MKWRAVVEYESGGSSVWAEYDTEAEAEKVAKEKAAETSRSLQFGRVTTAYAEAHKKVAGLCLVNCA